MYCLFCLGPLFAVSQNAHSAMVWQSASRFRSRAACSHHRFNNHGVGPIWSAVAFFLPFSICVLGSPAVLRFLWRRYSSSCSGEKLWLCCSIFSISKCCAVREPPFPFSWFLGILFQIPEFGSFLQVRCAECAGKNYCLVCDASYHWHTKRMLSHKLLECFHILGSWFCSRLRFLLLTICLHFAVQDHNRTYLLPAEAPPAPLPPIPQTEHKSCSISSASASHYANSLPFFKYHGTGNDFVLIDCLSNPKLLDHLDVKQLGQKLSCISRCNFNFIVSVLNYDFC